MKAARLLAPGEVAVVDVPEPAGDTIVAAEIMGICGTDVKIAHGAIPVELPRTLGHELVGRVVTGSDLAPGTRVLVDPAVACGTCPQCVRGRTNLCLRGGLMGREVDGAFAELAAVDANRLLEVPDGIDDRSAGLLQVLGTCVHGLAKIEIGPGLEALVLGLGVAGQLMVRLLAAAGAEVVGVTRSAAKRALALAGGAVRVAAPDEAESVISGGPQLVVEAVGTEATLARSIELAGTGADLVVFGTLTGGGTGLPYYQLYYKELTLWNPRAAVRADYARAIELVAGGLQVADIVTDVVPLGRAADAFARVEDPASLKVLIEA